MELVWSQEFLTRDEAKAAEKRIKGWSRAKKLALIRGDWDEIARLAKSKVSPSTSSGQAEVEIFAGAIHAIQSATRCAHPYEACGLLLGGGGRIIAFVETRNVHPTPATHFEIDPQALIDAHRAERQGGLTLLGYFHSHPTGEAEPSATDRASAAGDGKIWAIAAGGDVQFWQDEPDGFVALSYEIVER